MIPSKKYLGAKTYIPTDKIEEWVDQISYFINEGTTINLTIMDGFKVISEETYTKQDEIGLIKEMLSEQVNFEPVHLTHEDLFDETVINTDPSVKSDTVVKHRMAKYGIMFAYDDAFENTYDSYCNFTNTSEGGVHLDAVEKAFCNFLQKATKDSMSEKEKEKIDILWNDIRAGLKLVVYLSTNANVEFQGNVKEKINSQLLYDIILAGATKEISDYFNNNQDKLKSAIKIVKMNAKARIESTKARVASTKESMTPLKEQLIPNYDRCFNTGKNDYREIFIVEGDSAKGSASRRRNPDFQAFYAVRGMTANPYKKSITDMMNPDTGNKEWRNFVKILRCGFGKSFDLDKLYFDKIIILTDADIDGHGITSAISAFFIKCLPEVVKAGKLYKALPPLYSIQEGKKNNFIHDKKEYVDLYQEKVIKNYNIKIFEEKITKEEFKEYLFDTADYLSNLISISKHVRVDKFLIERIAAYIVFKFRRPDDIYESNQGFILKNQNEIKRFVSFIQEVYPEIKYDENENALTGVTSGHAILLKLDNVFIDKIYILFDVYRKYGYYIMVNEKGSNSNDYSRFSIGEFAEMYSKYVPKIGSRFKGLGEMSPMDLYNTTLDPDSRVLIRLTMNDLKKELKTFDMLHGTTEHDKKARKKMMKEFRIDPDDLDN